MLRRLLEVLVNEIAYAWCWLRRHETYTFGSGYWSCDKPCASLGVRWSVLFS